MQMESTNISDNHLKYYMKITQSNNQRLYGPEILSALKEMDTEYKNVEKGLKWSKESHNNEGVILAGAMGYYWQIRGRTSEAISWFENILEQNRGSHQKLIENLPGTLTAFFMQQFKGKHSSSSTPFSMSERNL